MTVIFASSLLLRLSALVFSLLLLRRQRHWALAVLAITLALMSLRLGLTWLAREQADGRMSGFPEAVLVGDEIPGLIVGACMLVSVLSIGRLLDEKRRLVARLEEEGARQQLLLRELNHRVRNNLASILTLIDLSAQSRSSVDDFARTIRRRVGSMSAAQNLLARPGSTPVRLREVAETVLGEAAPLVARISGPRVDLPPSKVQAFGMILQELTSNSLKHGASLGERARITLTWRTAADDGGPERVELCWAETAREGLEAIEPGAGLSLVRGILEHELDGALRTGVHGGEIQHRIEFPLTNGNSTEAERIGASSA